MSSRFLLLPRELLIQILSVLSHRDLLSCKCVSRLVNEVVRESVVLRYLIEAEVAGVEDNPHSRLVIAERLDKLKRREDAWAHFKVNSRMTVPIPHSTSGIYDLSGGIYLLGTAAPYDRSITTDIKYLRLPTSPETPETPDWSEIKIGFESTGRRIIDVGIALREHDLIAFVTSLPQDHNDRDIDIVLMNLSTGAYHTQAQQPVIRVMRSPEEISLNLEIVGDRLALLLIFPSAGSVIQDMVFIYDWKSGRLNMNFLTVHGTYYGLVFLTEDVLLLANTDKGSFDLCQLSPVGDVSTTLTITHSLNLPQLRPNCRFLRILCRSDPNHYRKLSDPCSQAPFYSSPDEALVLFDISVLTFDGMHLVRSFSFVVHRHALLAHLPSSPPSVPSHTPWERWGHPVTRWFNTDNIPTRWITTTHGQRWVLTTSDARVVPRRIYVLDFNPYLVRRARATSEFEENDRPVVIVHDDNSWASGLFSEPVIGRLPYVQYMSSQNFDYDAVLMDEQNVIGIGLDADSEMMSQIEILHFG